MTRISRDHLRFGMHCVLLFYALPSLPPHPFLLSSIIPLCSLSLLLFPLLIFCLACVSYSFLTQVPLSLCAMSPRTRSSSPSPAGPLSSPTVACFRTWVQITSAGAEWLDVDGTPHVCPLAFLETPSCTPAKLLSLALLAPNILSDCSQAFLLESSSDFFVCSYATALNQLQASDFASISATLGIDDLSTFRAPTSGFTSASHKPLSGRCLRLAAASLDP